MKKIKLLRIIIISLLTWYIFTNVIIVFQVRSSEDIEELKNGSWHILCKLNYLFSEPELGDIVGIKLTGNSVFLTSKIIGKPGDSFKNLGNQIVFNNGNKIQAFKKYEKERLSDSEYFVHSGSIDNPVNGIISSERIIGKVLW